MFLCTLPVSPPDGGISFSFTIATDQLFCQFQLELQVGAMWFGWWQVWRKPLHYICIAGRYINKEPKYELPPFFTWTTRWVIWSILVTNRNVFRGSHTQVRQAIYFNDLGKNVGCILAVVEQPPNSAIVLCSINTVAVVGHAYNWLAINVCLVLQSPVKNVYLCIWSKTCSSQYRVPWVLLLPLFSLLS